MHRHTPATPVQTLSIAGGKGGDGKSNVALNLSVALAKTGNKVILLDGNLSMGNICRLLDLDPRFDVSHVFGGAKTLAEIILDGPGGIKIVPGSSGNLELARLSQIQHIGLVNSFSELDLDADILIIDNDSGLSQSVLSFTSAARENLIIVCDDPMSINDAIATIKVLSENCRCERFRIVANKVDSSQHGIELFSRLLGLVGQQLDVVLDFCGSIPVDVQLQKAVSERRAVVDAYPRAKSALSFAKLAARVERWPRPLEPEGHLEFFVERLVSSGLDAR